MNLRPNLGAFVKCSLESSPDSAKSKETLIKSMKIIKFFALSLVVSALSGLTSCHTMAGLGRDLEKAANGIQNVIQR